jgi:adenylate cyclase
MHGTMDHAIETEFKLRAVRDLEVAAVDAALRGAGFVAGSSDAGQHVDVYLDDGEGSLRRAGLGLRLRENRSERRLTCKARGERNGSRFVRTEWDAAWSSPSLPHTAGDLPDVLRDRVEPFVLDRPLVEILRLSTHRDRRLLQRDQRDLCELAIDRVQAAAAGRAATFCEVEIEALDDVPTCEQLADRLLQTLPLQPAADDKPGHASALLGLQRPAPSPMQLAPTTPVGAAIATIAAPHLLALQQAEIGVRRDEHPEHLHAMRVALRRLRAIVRSFRDLWPAAESQRLLEHLGESGRRLGELRDLDVLLTDLPPAIERLPAPLQQPRDAVLEWIGDQRRRTVAQVQAWLRSPARLADQRHLVALLDGTAITAAASESELAVALPPRLAAAARKVRKLAAALPPDLPLAPLHALRIACKRLRYLAEEFQSLPGLDWAKSLARLVRLQQALGTVCDRENAAARLIAWIPAAAAATGDGVAVAAMLGGVAARTAADAARARQRARRALARAHRPKVYRRFESLPMP